MSEPLSTGKKKILYVEILRILAIVFVIFNHTNSYGYTHFTLCEIGSFPYWFCMFFSVLCKFSVPLFFMISGMMLLGKEETLCVLWKKRILKYAAILVLFSLIHYLWESLPAGRTFSIKEFLLLFYTNGVVDEVWFLYLYLAFLMMLPFLRKTAQNMKPQEFNYLVVIYIVFCGVFFYFEYLIFKGAITLNNNLIPTNVLGVTVFYPLMGFYIGNKVKEISKKTCMISAVLFVASIPATMFMTDFRIKVTGELRAGLESFYVSLQPLYVFFIFVIIRKLFENKALPKPFEKLLITVGGSVFGIYLIEKMVRQSLWGIFETMDSKISTFAAIWIYVLIVFIVTAAIVVVFRFLLNLLKPRKKA